MATKGLERRVLTLANTPVRLRKRRQGRRARRAEGEDEEEEAPADDRPKDEAAEGEPEGEEDEGEGQEEAEGEEDDEEGAADDDSPGTLEGYAAVFHAEGDEGTEYELYSAPGFRATERIARGAFSRAIKEQDDVRALVNHEPDQLIGRTGAGTCRVEEDERGLRYSVDLPDTTVGRDTARLVARGDMSGSSFGFVVEQESWRETELPDGTREAVRTVESVRLLDVGPVTYPAYSGTSAASAGRSAGAPVRALGSVEEARASYERWRRGALPLAAKLAQVRARSVQVQSGR